MIMTPDRWATGYMPEVALQSDISCRSGTRCGGRGPGAIRRWARWPAGGKTGNPDRAHLELLRGGSTRARDERETRGLAASAHGSTCGGEGVRAGAADVNAGHLRHAPEIDGGIDLDTITKPPSGRGGRVVARFGCLSRRDPGGCGRVRVLVAPGKGMRRGMAKEGKEHWRGAPVQS